VHAAGAPVDQAQVTFPADHLYIHSRGIPATIAAATTASAAAISKSGGVSVYPRMG